MAVQHEVDPSTAVTIGEWIVFGMITGPPAPAALLLLALALRERD